MFSFALIRPRADEWRGWLPLALALAMFAALLALGGDRGYFYRKGEFHEFDTIKDARHRRASVAGTRFPSGVQRLAG